MFDTVNPQWYETLYFRGKDALKGLPRPDQLDEEDSEGFPITHCVWPKLTLHLFDKDEWGKDDFLGRVSVRLGDIKQSMYSSTVPRWEKVKRADTDSTCGELLCSFQLIPLAISSDDELKKLSRVREFQAVLYCCRFMLFFYRFTLFFKSFYAVFLSFYAIFQVVLCCFSSRFMLFLC